VCVRARARACVCVCVCVCVNVRGLQLQVEAFTCGNPMQAPWTLTLHTPEDVTLQDAVNATLVDIRDGTAGLRASEPSLSLEAGQKNTAILSVYVNAPSMVRSYTPHSKGGYHVEPR
jgi:hypothetical protein